MTFDSAFRSVGIWFADLHGVTDEGKIPIAVTENSIAVIIQSLDPSLSKIAIALTIRSFDPYRCSRRIAALK